MSTSPIPGRVSTRQIAADEWIPFLAEFTRQNRGAHARLEVIGGETLYRVETENKPFDGVSADIKDRERAIWIMFGATPADRISHGIQQADALNVLSDLPGSGPVLEVEARDGTKTLLTLSKPGAFAIPGEAGRTAR